MAHCGECHTPRTLAFSLDNRRKFAGAKQAGWIAYNISGDKETGIGEWKPEEIAQYVGSGHAAGAEPRTDRWPRRSRTAFATSRQRRSAIAAYVASVPAVKRR
jgi:mono/diheme cytochrome c family protein